MKECDFCFGENHKPTERLRFISYRTIDNETHDGDACPDCVDAIWFDDNIEVTDYECWT